MSSGVTAVRIVWLSSLLSACVQTTAAMFRVNSLHTEICACTHLCVCACREEKVRRAKQRRREWLRKIYAQTCQGDPSSSGNGVEQGVSGGVCMPGSSLADLNDEELDDLQVCRHTHTHTHAHTHTHTPSLSFSRAHTDTHTSSLSFSRAHTHTHIVPL